MNLKSFLCFPYKAIGKHLTLWNDSVWKVNFIVTVKILIICDLICRSLTECRSQHSVASSCDQVEHPIVHHYPVDPNNVGYCVIINQKKFYRDQSLCRKVGIVKLYSCQSDFIVLLFTMVCFWSPEQGVNEVVLGSQSEVADHELDLRLGTDMDRDRLSETFYSLGFTVWIGQNLTHSDLLKSVQLTLETRVKKEHSCFVLCILSHGERGEFAHLLILDNYF